MPDETIVAEVEFDLGGVVVPVPTEDYVMPSTLIQTKLYRIREHMRNTGVCRFRAMFTASTTAADVSEEERYFPICLIWPGLQQMRIVGDFKTTSELNNNNTTDADLLARRILTGLPRNNSGGDTTGWMLHDCLTWFDPNTDQFRTASVNYQHDGWLMYYSPDGFTIPANTLVHIDTGNVFTSPFEADYAFPALTAEDIAAATAWIKNHQGQFTYSNDLGSIKNGAQTAGKNDAVTSGFTDCSGLIFNAFFRSSAGKFVPNFANAQGGFGRVISYAPKGENLDLSAAREGDVVILIRPEMGYGHHIEYYDGEKLWHVNTSYADGQTKGPQPVAGTYPPGGPNAGAQTDETFGKTNNARILLRWADEADDTFDIPATTLHYPGEGCGCE